MTICFDYWKLVEITNVKPKKTYFNGWRRYGYEIKPEDLMKHHWNNSCFKTNKHIEAVLKGPAHLLARSKSEILREKSSDRKGILYSKKITSDSLSQFDRTSESEIFVSSIYTEQNNLNHLNHPKNTVLRLRDGQKSRLFN